MKKNNKTNKGKKTSVLKIVILVLILILIGELIFFGIRAYKIRRANPHYQISSDIIKIDNGYVGVGLSDFKNSKFNNYQKKGDQKAVIWQFNNDFKIIKEVKLNLGYKSYFNSIKKVSDGYIAVGTIQMTKKQSTESVGEALIAKYDENFKLIWRKNVKILDNTEFIKAEIDKDNNIIVVGRSVYAADLIGNHKTGGAIIMRFDSNGEEKMRANYGGPQTGVYNDLLIEKDGYVVVGASLNNTGMIRKYDFNGKEKWHSFYGYTDQKGFTSITKSDNDYVVTGSELPSKKETSKYKALLVKYNINGKMLDDITYKKSEVNRFDSIIYDNNSLIAVGYYGKKEKDTMVTNGIVVKFSKDLVEEKANIFSLDHNEVYSKIYKIDNDYLLLGYTNSKYKPSKTNGFDYYPVFNKYDKNLNKK